MSSKTLKTAPLRIVVGLALLMGMTVQAAPTPMFQATMLDLPGLPGDYDSSRVWGIGISGGLIVGESIGADGPRATAWSSNGVPTLLEDSTFGSSAYAVTLNGRIVGFGETLSTGTRYQAVSWSTANANAYAPTTIGDASGASEARAAADRFTAGALSGGAFVHDGSTLTMLGTFGSVAYGVRGDGLAVGKDAGGAAVVFGGRPDGSADIVLAAKGAAWAILGDQVVGSYDDSRGQHAFLTTLDGGQPDLLDLFDGAAFALNDSGTAVGTDANGEKAWISMIFDGIRQDWDLNTLVDAANLGGFTLTQARGIDDDGTIVAFGFDGSVERAFVLHLDATGGTGGSTGGGQSAPEPSTVVLALLGLALLARRSRP